MEIGTGIFLASVVLGSVALFIATKDRWNWKKITVRTLLSLVALGVLVPGGFYLRERLERRPSAEVSLWGLRLAQSKDDVRFLKGEPRHVWGASEGAPERWLYRDASQSGWYGVGFQDGLVTHVFYDGDRLYAPNLQGVSAYDDLTDITDHLGQPEKLKASEDGLRRFLLYPKWRTWFVVTGAGIVTRGIYDPSRWEPAAGQGRWMEAPEVGPWTEHQR